MPKLCTVFARIDLVDVTWRDDAGIGYFRNRRNQKLSAGATSVKRSSVPELIIGAVTETAFEITPSSCDFLFHFFLHQLYTIHTDKKFQEHIHEITSLCGFQYAHRQFKWWAEPLWHHPLVCEMLFQNRGGAKSADLNAGLRQLMAQVICFTLPAAAAHLQTTLQPYTPSAVPIHAASDWVRNVLAAGTSRSQSRPTKPNINYCSQYSFDYSGPDWLAASFQLCWHRF